MTSDESKKIIEAKHVSGSDWKWTICLPHEDAGKFKIQELTLSNQKHGKSYACPILKHEAHLQTGTVIETDMSPLKDTIENCRNEEWIVTIGGRSLVESDLKDKFAEKKKDIFRRRFELFKEPIGQMPFADKTVEILPYCSPNGEWKIAIGDRCLRYSQALKCVGIDNGFVGNKPFFKVRCPLIEGLEWTGMVLTYRYRTEDERKDYFFDISRKKKEDKSIVAYTVADIEGLAFHPINWDVRMVFEKDGEQYWCAVTNPYSGKSTNKDKEKKGELRRLFSKQSIMLDDDCQMSIISTDYGNTSVIVQRYTPYSGLGFRLKERLAILIYKLFRKRLKEKNIFLVFEKFCSMAQDNGYYFFKYCMDNNAEEKLNRHIYYIIDKKQKDYKKVANYDEHVIQFMSLKHMVYTLAARLFISSDSRRHAYAWRASESVIRQKVLNEKKSVFLQHGVFGLKRSDEFKRGTGGGTNLFIASNELEKGYIVEDMDYKPDEVAITGLARWDVLEDKSFNVEQNRILVMPTWRKWLEETTDEIFTESEYYHKYMQLINSKELSDILEQQDLWMDFYIHPKFSDMIKTFSTTTDRIRLIPFGSSPLNELIMECRMLVTDYSSVAWDVYYQSKPVIFYQFDIDKYNEVQGAYMDLEEDLFGDRAETQEELLKLLKETAESDFQLKPQYAKVQHEMYKYIDHNNSKRICDEIAKRGW